MAKMSTPAIPRFWNPFCVCFCPRSIEFLANLGKRGRHARVRSLWTAERQVVQQQAFLERCTAGRRCKPSTPVKHCFCRRRAVRRAP